MCKLFRSFYRLPYLYLFGGIEAFRKEHFLSVNGFTNLFWGWGGEDDDLYFRVRRKGLRLNRPDAKIARYKMNHAHHNGLRVFSPEHMAATMKKAINMHVDGLNSIRSLNYTVTITEHDLYTLVSINLYRT